MPKIFTVKGYPITLSGKYFSNSKFYSEIFDEFTKNQLTSSDVEDVMRKLKDYLLSRHSISDTQTFLMAGYMDNYPRIMAFNKKAAGWQKTYIKTSNDSATNYAKTFIKENLTTKQAVPLIEKLMKDHSRSSERRKISVGGPTCIVRLNPDNSITWIQNKFDRTRFQSLNSLNIALRKGQIKIVELVPNTLNEILVVIRKLMSMP